MTDTTTVQLRRYELVPGTMDDFIEWFTTRLIPARLAQGFTIEFAYANRAENEYVWAVSTPGDAVEFARIEEEYTASAARAEAFDGVPQRVAVYHVELVERIA